VLLAVLAAAIYYMFFAPPTVATLPVSGTLGALAPLAQSSTQPQLIETSPALQALSSTIPQPTSTGPVGKKRPNPFLAP